MQPRDVHGNLQTAQELDSVTEKKTDEEREDDPIVLHTDTTKSQMKKAQKRKLTSNLTCNMTPFQSQLLKRLDTESTDNEGEADKNFLLSLLPDYRKLKDMDKLDFRIMILQYFQHKQMENLSAAAPSSPPASRFPFPTQLHSRFHYNNPYSRPAYSLPASPFVSTLSPIHYPSGTSTDYSISPPSNYAAQTHTTSPLSDCSPISPLQMYHPTTTSHNSLSPSTANPEQPVSLQDTSDYSPNVSITE